MAEILEATNLETTLALLSTARGAVRVRSSDAHAGMRLTRDTIGPISIDHASFGMDLDADVGPAQMLVFGQVISGAAGFRAGSTERWHRVGDIYLAAQPGHCRTSMVRGGEHDQAVFDQALPSQIADTAPGRTQQPVRFTGYAPVSPEAARWWKAAYAYVREMLADPGTAAQQLLHTCAARLLVATTLATFPNNALTEPTIEDRNDAHTATLHRAVAFIDENAHTDITVADIAAASFVTIRAVQLAFRRHMDTTPLGYLRRVRLHGAHHDLLTSDPVRENVTAVAYRWGFPSPSRFAATYRRAYCVTPNYTLHN
jgi:AraC-like DNA-binding protein